MTWLDVSVPIRMGMVVYEGDPPVIMERTASMDAGAMCNVSRLDFGVHTGTHVDAPVHFLEGGSGAESVPLDALLGPCFVVDATHLTGDIDARKLGTLNAPLDVERLLFKTPNSALWERSGFSSAFIGLTEDAARALVHRGVRLVGIDYLSIAPRHDPAPTHRALLEAGIVILEGLDLRAVEPGPYELACLPLKIEDSDGAPARALLRSR
ncbi:MAG TPA: cyclase family protein [Tepidiformaceae bacterium]|nr:cyclase family protein [Tepidiformaceae bacterium]